MLINLQEVPDSGRTWFLDRQTAELNEVLRPLLGTQEYWARLSIVPLSEGSSFDVHGTFKTKLPEQCSRCGDDFQLDLDEKFQNLLLPTMDMPRNGKIAKANHFSDLHQDGPEPIEYVENVFDVGEFFYELVVLAKPMIPSPPKDTEGNCSICKQSAKSFIHCDSGNQEPSHAFEALKKLKFD